MTVGNWKRLLTLLNLAAILAMAGTAYGYVAHKQYLDDPHVAPSFQPDPRPAEEIYADTAHTGIPLGAPIEPVKAGPNKGEMAKPKEEKLTALAMLGSIENAVAVTPPFIHAVPTIEFKFKADGKKVIVRRGEALVNRPDPRRTEVKVPAQYRLVTCRADEKMEGLYHFVFDVRCNGKEWATLPWYEGGMPPQEMVDASKRRLFSPSSGPGALIDWAEGEDEYGEPTDAQLRKAIEQRGTRKKADVVAIPKGTESAKGEEVSATPGEPAGPTEVISEPVEPRGVRYWKDDPDTGTSGMTEEGVRYLKDNWKELTKEVKLTPYRNSKTKQIEGVRVRRISEGSVARQFGIREQDVIVSINGQRVTSQKQAISVIKREVNQRKKTKITVVIRRAGREFTKNYDTRDPEARKAARDYARGRR